MLKKVVVFVILIGVLGSFVNAQSTPTCLEPSVGTAVVDGVSSEWDLTADFAANLYVAGNILKPVAGNLYLRYDCREQRLFVLVLSTDGSPINESLDEIWVRIDGAPQPVEFTSFALVGDVAVGWEAVFPLTEAAMVVHTNVLLDGQWETGATSGLSVCPVCPATAVLMSYFTAEDCGDGVTLRWETAMEIDVLGFNLYSMPKFAEWNYETAVLLNQQMIPASGGFEGMEYSFAVPDGDVETLDYWIMIEKVDGSAVVHGPASPLSCLPPIRYRIFLPMVGG